MDSHVINGIDNEALSWTQYETFDDIDCTIGDLSYWKSQSLNHVKTKACERAYKKQFSTENKNLKKIKLSVIKQDLEQEIQGFTEACFNFFSSYRDYFNLNESGYDFDNIYEGQKTLKKLNKAIKELLNHYWKIMSKSNF